MHAKLSFLSTEFAGVENLETTVVCSTQATKTTKLALFSPLNCEYLRMIAKNMLSIHQYSISCSGSALSSLLSESWSPPFHFETWFFSSSTFTVLLYVTHHLQMRTPGNVDDIIVCTQSGHPMFVPLPIFWLERFSNSDAAVLQNSRVPIFLVSTSLRIPCRYTFRSKQNAYQRFSQALLRPFWPCSFAHCNFLWATHWYFETISWCRILSTFSFLAVLLKPLLPLK